MKRARPIVDHVTALVDELVNQMLGQHKYRGSAARVVDVEMPGDDAPPAAA
jgi:hypothetical protein